MLVRNRRVSPIDQEEVAKARKGLPYLVGHGEPIGLVYVCIVGKILCIGASTVNPREHFNRQAGLYYARKHEQKFFTTIPKAISTTLACAERAYDIAEAFPKRTREVVRFMVARVLTQGKLALELEERPALAGMETSSAG